jgi:hypothetical protein
MPGGGIGHDECRSVDWGKLGGQRDAAVRRCHGMGAKPAGATQAGHGLSNLEVLDAFTHRANHPGVFRARHKGQGRLHLVFVLHDEQVGEIQAGGLYLDQDFTGLGFGGGQLGPFQGFDADGVFTQPSMHGGFLYRVTNGFGDSAVDDREGCSVREAGRPALCRWCDLAEAIEVGRIGSG